MARRSDETFRAVDKLFKTIATIVGAYFVLLLIVIVLIIIGLLTYGPDLMNLIIEKLGAL